MKIIKILLINDTLTNYNCKELDLQLHELYTGGTYNFLLRPTTIKNIIDKWISNSNKFK